MSPPEPSAQPAAKPQPPADTAADSEQVGASGLTADEERTLGELQAKKAAAETADQVRMKVEPPHESMQFGHYVIGSEFTAVPAAMAGPLTEAADRAGVTITQEA
jgi:hypothetical protein